MYKVVLISLLISLGWCDDIGGDHDAQSKEDMFHEVVHIVKNDSTSVHGFHLSQVDTDTLIEKVFENVGCDLSCKCLSVSSLSTIPGFPDLSSDGLSNQTYPKLSTVLLYYIWDPQTVCSSTPDPSVNSYSYYKLWLSGSNLDTLRLNLDTIVQSLEELTEDDHHDEEEEHHDEEDEDHHDEDEDHDEEEDDHEHEECLDILGIMGSADTVTTMDEKVEYIAASITLRILEGHSIKRSCHEEEGLPQKEAFIGELFEHFNVTEGQTMGHEAFEKLLESFGVGGHGHEEEGHAHGEEEDDHEDEGHDDHRRKRETRRRKRDAEELEKCFSADELLEIYHVDEEAGITESQFQQICPAILQQQMSGVCAEEDHNDTDTEALTQAQQYGYSILSVLLISLCALLGVLFIPCMNTRAYTYVMNIFVALAVGTLLGDAFLHLIPEAFGLHAHGEHDDHAHDEEEGLVVEPYFYKALVVLFSIYIFFLLETVMNMGMNTGNQVKHGHSHTVDEQTIEKAQMAMKTPESASKADLVNNDVNSNNQLDGSKTDVNDGDTSATKTNICKSIKPVAIMVILGDSLHNFFDGLAIGAAFTTGWPGGLSTSIAVFCHELPHELGDFAVLLNAGMSIKLACLFNFISALTALIGCIVGVSISVAPEASQWVFTIVGGIFIYVAMVDMMPELMVMQRGEQRCLMFILQNIGFLLGVLLLTLIALYEEQISFG